MKVAGFSFIRNAVKNDYPIVEAITSILPICDEFVIAVGACDDGTRDLIENIQSPKIKIIDTLWDDNLREGGRVFAQETDKAFDAISSDADWAFYIQGDECVHEKYLDLIKAEMAHYKDNDTVEGLLFKYKHFYGSYDYYAESRRWYRREIRIVKRKLNVRSYRDAQGFRIDNRKIAVKLIDAEIYHYGWVKPPKGILHKMQNFSQFYNPNNIIASVADDASFDYGNADQLFHFNQTHPTVMLNRVEKSNWKFDFDPTLIKNKMPLKNKISALFEKYTGQRLFEYKNYTLLS